MGKRKLEAEGDAAAAEQLVQAQEAAGESSLVELAWAGAQLAGRHDALLAELAGSDSEVFRCLGCRSSLLILWTGLYSVCMQRDLLMLLSVRLIR